MKLRETIETPIVEEAAATAYDLHRRYRAGEGEQQPTWGNAEWTYKNRLRAAARKILEEELDAEGVHASWVAEKVAAGWQAGDPQELMDEKKKLHPYLVAWEELPGHERAARALFAATCHGVASRMANPKPQAKRLVTYVRPKIEPKPVEASDPSVDELALGIRHAASPGPPNQALVVRAPDEAILRDFAEAFINDDLEAKVRLAMRLADDAPDAPTEAPE